LALRTLRSPIDGVVVDQARFPGELVDGGEGKPYILKIAQTHPLRVKMILPAAYFGRIKPGMKADVVPEKPADGRYTATVINVDKMIDAASGTFQVRMEQPNPGGALPGGLKCKVSLPAL
jgi:multidrug efflux pump subunit AcrA (membrane-fusion protein)